MLSLEVAKNCASYAVIAIYVAMIRPGIPNSVSLATSDWIL
jgi:hypothetical protein